MDTRRPYGVVGYRCLLECSNVSRSCVESAFALEGIGTLQDTNGLVVYAYNDYPGGELAIHWGEDAGINLDTLRKILSLEGLDTKVIPHIE